MVSRSQTPAPGEGNGGSRRERLEKAVFRHLDRIREGKRASRRGSLRAAGVHKMRVSTRRLREALILLGEAIRTDRAESIARRTRKLTRALGEVRALDVSVGLLKRGFRGPERAAAAFAAGKLAAERRRREEGVARALARFKGGSYRKELAGLFRRLKGDFDRRWVRAAAKVLRRRRERLIRGLRPSGGLLKERMHDFRVGLKKLRYDLEILEETGGRMWRARLAALKRHQTLFGNWHDHEVLGAHLEAVRRALGPSERGWEGRLGALSERVAGREARLAALIEERFRSPGLRLLGEAR